MMQKQRAHDDVVSFRQRRIEHVLSEELYILDLTLAGAGGGIAHGKRADIAAIDEHAGTGASGPAGDIDRHVTAAAGQIKQAPGAGRVGRNPAFEGLPEDAAAAAEAIDAPQPSECGAVQRLAQAWLIHQLGLALATSEAVEHFDPDVGTAGHPAWRPASQRPRLERRDSTFSRAATPFVLAPSGL